MNKAYLLIICLLLTSFTGCIEVSDLEEENTDEIKDDWDFSGMVEDAQILFRVGYAIGQHNEWPQWSEGTEFKAKREAMLKSN